MISPKNCLPRFRDVLLAVSALIAFSFPSAKASTIFTENFNSYVGNQNDNQRNTGYPVAYGGNIPGWSHSGINAIHAVNPSGASDWEVMFYNDNTITLLTPIAGSNIAGQNYSLTFAYGTGCYSSLQCTQLGDGLIVELLDINSNVIAQNTYLPGAWGPGNYDLQAGLKGTLSYTGTGSGNLSITILTNPQAHSNTFGGTIDNLALDTIQSAPEPSAFMLVGIGLIGVTLSVTQRHSFKVFTK